MSDIRQTHYVDTDEAAWILEVSPSTVRRWRAKGDIPVAYTVSDSARVLAYRYDRSVIALIARTNGLWPRCLACGLLNQTHPVEECPGGFVSSWDVRR